MANEIIIGAAILVGAIVLAWVLSWKTRKGAGKHNIDCPHCQAKMPHDAHACPSCSRPIHRCPTCGAFVLDRDHGCEVCGEAVNRGPGKQHACPKCNTQVAAASRKCPRCGEEYWSPIVTEK